MARFKWVSSLTLALTVVIGSIAQAEAPNIFYSWRSLEGTVDQCLEQANQALETQAFAEIQRDGNSIGGHTDNDSAMFVCLEGDGDTTVMVIVSGVDGERAIALREALKAAF